MAKPSGPCRFILQARNVHLSSPCERISQETLGQPQCPPTRTRRGFRGTTPVALSLAHLNPPPPLAHLVLPVVVEAHELLDAVQVVCMMAAQAQPTAQRPSKAAEVKLEARLACLSCSCPATARQRDATQPLLCVHIHHVVGAAEDVGSWRGLRVGRQASAGVGRWGGLGRAGDLKAGEDDMRSGPELAGAGKGEKAGLHQWGLGPT